MIKIFVRQKEGRPHRSFPAIRECGVAANYDDVLRDVKARDERDATRKDAPMKPAEDAYILDTSWMGIEDVFEKAVAIIEEKVK